jgi:antitoxin CptB
MRELDLLLDGFLENRYEALSPDERDSFERLLDCRNEDLLNWLVEGATPQDQPLLQIIEQIRKRAP